MFLKGGSYKSPLTIRIKYYTNRVHVCVLVVRVDRRDTLCVLSHIFFFSIIILPCGYFISIGDWFHFRPLLPHPHKYHIQPPMFYSSISRVFRFNVILSKRLIIIMHHKFGCLRCVEISSDVSRSRKNESHRTRTSHGIPIKNSYYFSQKISTLLIRY